MNKILKIKRQLKTPDQLEAKKQVNKIIIGILLFELIMTAGVLLDAIIQIIRVAVVSMNHPDLEQQVDAALMECLNSGRATIISLTAGIIFLFFFFRKQDFSKKLFDKKQPMKASAFFFILTLFMSTQLVFLAASVGGESLFNMFGYSIMAEIESATNTSTVFSMFLYASFIGPIAEELVFRGFVMRGLARFGKITAILCSALLFGAFHGNLIQGVFAVTAGMVLGYVAMEYSILWAIAIHVINNFIFGDLWAYVTGGFNETLQLILFYGVYSSFFVGAVILLVLKRKEIRNYWNNNKNENGYYKIIFTSLWFILFMILHLALGISGIHKL
ncbi:CPBP family intramembrane glutamic endopeptidase [Lacrimispora sp.]|uniref:CPBP family intramembrane glutamic endopeptidase n=1 Tax=Lacrimispora sp. TaxID=2719234 RepID=UPI003994F2AA